MQENTSINLVPRNENGQLMAGARLNPAGKPLGARHLSTKLNEAIQSYSNGQLNSKKLIDILIEKAFTGDMRAIELIYDRLEGKAIQAVIARIESDNAKLTPEQEARLKTLLEKSAADSGK